MPKLSLLAVLAAGLAVLPAALGHADDIALNFTPGLWQITSTPHMSGAIPDADLAKMTAEQRAKLEANMGKAMAPRTMKQCLTRDKLEQGFQQGNTAGCQRSVVANSPTELNVRQQCSDANGTRQLTFQIQTPSPDTLMGVVNIEATRGGKTITITNNLQGKFLAADCGDVTAPQPVN